MLNDPNQSLMQEMWKALKFALDLRAGDSKPVPGREPKGSSSSGSKTGSLLENGDAESHPYGVISRNGKESPYAAFNETTYNSQRSGASAGGATSPQRV